MGCGKEGGRGKRLTSHRGLEGGTAWAEGCSQYRGETKREGEKEKSDKAEIDKVFHTSVRNVVKYGCYMNHHPEPNAGTGYSLVVVVEGKEK
jgi:hypothetical protein